MTPTNALDVIVSALAGLEVRLSGDDSPLANPWEEIKEQLQHEQSVYWLAYVETMQQFVSGFVAHLSDEDLGELRTGLKCSSGEAWSSGSYSNVSRLAAKRKKSAMPLLTSSTSVTHCWTLRCLDG